MAQLVTNPPAMPETWLWSLGWEDPAYHGATRPEAHHWRAATNFWAGTSAPSILPPSPTTRRKQASDSTQPQAAGNAGPHPRCHPSSSSSGSQRVPSSSLAQPGALLCAAPHPSEPSSAEHPDGPSLGCRLPEDRPEGGFTCRGCWRNTPRVCGLPIQPNARSHSTDRPSLPVPQGAPPHKYTESTHSHRPLPRVQGVKRLNAGRPLPQKQERTVEMGHPEGRVRERWRPNQVQPSSVCLQIASVHGCPQGERERGWSVPTHCLWPFNVSRSPRKRHSQRRVLQAAGEMEGWWWQVETFLFQLFLSTVCTFKYETILYVVAC